MYLSEVVRKVADELLKRLPFEFDIEEKGISSPYLGKRKEIRTECCGDELDEDTLIRIYGTKWLEPNKSGHILEFSLRSWETNVEDYQDGQFGFGFCRAHVFSSTDKDKDGNEKTFWFVEPLDSSYVSISFELLNKLSVGEKTVEEVVDTIDIDKYSSGNVERNKNYWTDFSSCDKMMNGGSYYEYIKLLFGGKDVSCSEVDGRIYCFDRETLTKLCQIPAELVDNLNDMTGFLSYLEKEGYPLLTLVDYFKKALKEFNNLDDFFKVREEKDAIILDSKQSETLIKQINVSTLNEKKEDCILIKSALPKTCKEEGNISERVDKFLFDMSDYNKRSQAMETGYYRYMSDTLISIRNEICDRELISEKHINIFKEAYAEAMDVPLESVETKFSAERRKLFLTSSNFIVSAPLVEVSSFMHWLSDDAFAVEINVTGGFGCFDGERRFLRVSSLEKESLVSFIRSAFVSSRKVLQDFKDKLDSKNVRLNMNGRSVEIFPTFDQYERRGEFYSVKMLTTTSGGFLVDVSEGAVSTSFVFTTIRKEIDLLEYIIRPLFEICERSGDQKGKLVKEVFTYLHDFKDTLNAEGKLEEEDDELPF